MNFLHRNKKVVNAGAFTESAYEVLNYEQLLKVNGAGGGSGEIQDAAFPGRQERRRHPVRHPRSGCRVLP